MWCGHRSLHQGARQDGDGHDRYSSLVVLDGRPAVGESGRQPLWNRRPALQSAGDLWYRLYGQIMIWTLSSLYMKCLVRRQRLWKEE